MMETKRLRLVAPTLGDFEESYAMSIEAAVQEFTGGKPMSREDVWNKVLRNIGHWRAFGFGIFTVRNKVDGSHIGEVGLAHFGRGMGEAFDPFPEAAWVLATRAHGQGYATEAGVAAHDWMDQTWAPKRTVCIIHPENAVSIRVANKLGYASFGQAQYRDAAPIMFRRD